ncbi:MULTISPECIES: hypothetical protein [unclassified Acinetobacter]|uniref:hypothetical protein n=1 Tax=unclassified Acinetobacter TaxID=196816 RepID=UPI0015D2D10A|nr:MULTISPECIES: hypothetical protein [unclassified Acinetobacter]
MFIQVDAESNKTALRHYLTAFIFLLIIISPFAIYLVSCTPESEIEQHFKTPPNLYNSETNTLLDSSLQWLIPPQQIQNHNTIPEISESVLNEMTEGQYWSSTPITLQNQSDQLYVHIDFAGQQQTRKDLEISVLPLCIVNEKETPCMKAGLNASGQIFNISTQKNTQYHTLETNKSWMFYGQDFQENYIIPPQATLKFLVKANIPEHLTLQWLRLSIGTSPIVEKQQNFMVMTQNSMKIKYALALLPLFIFALMHIFQGFESLRNLSIGALSALLFVINTIIWDIHYMVIGCLILCFASVCYCFESRYYRLLYLTGYLLIAGYSQQYYGGFNKHFFAQTSLILLIGLSMFYLEPKDS